MRAVGSIHAARAARNAHCGLTGLRTSGLRRVGKGASSNIFACKKISRAVPTRARSPLPTAWAKSQVSARRVATLAVGDFAHPTSYCCPPTSARGKLQRGGTPCGNNLSCCCPVRLGGAAGLAGAEADASAAGAASAGAAVATTGFLQSVSQTS